MIHKHSRIPGDDAGELELRHPTVHKEVHVRFREEIGDDMEVRFVLGGVEGRVENNMQVMFLVILLID